MKKILIVGSTGSIGRQTLEVVKNNQEYFKVVGLIGNNNIELLEKQTQEFSPIYVGSFNQQIKTSYLGHKKLYKGEKEVLNIIERAECDTVVLAVAGSVGLRSALAAIKAGKDLALATKEVMVMAGELIKKEADKKKVNLLPIDSEHSAIWQSLRAGDNNEVEKLILTCSGGPFRNFSQKQIQRATVADALKHPNWKMGQKITIDSATLMNKGLEVIEARWLFDILADNIEVVIHSQSILHSAVLFKDSSMIGQLGMPDMRIPIQYSLSYPRRFYNNLPRLDLTAIGELTFTKPDCNKFPCLTLAYQALKVGGSMPAVLNAADEIAVELFLNNEIKFLDIPRIIAATMENHHIIKNPSIEEILTVDNWAKAKAKTYENN